MTTATVTGNANMIEGRRDPANCRMTVIARIGAGYMRQRLSGCDRAIMARTTTADYLAVIDRIRRCPQRVVVTILTSVGRIDVRDTLTYGRYAIVTTGAVSRDARVIERGRNPGHRRVTVFADVVARNVRWRLTGGNNAVMTGCAGTGQVRVIDDRHNLPVRRLMALGALANRRDMFR